jgi:hypothetical protein
MASNRSRRPRRFSKIPITKSCQICGETEHNTILIQTMPDSIFYKCPTCMRQERFELQNRNSPRKIEAQNLKILANQKLIAYLDIIRGL